MSYCYYFGTYKKPVFELLEKGKIDQALAFIRDHRRRDDLCDRHRAELWILEAHCHQASHNLWRSQLALEMAEEEVEKLEIKAKKIINIPTCQTMIKKTAKKPKGFWALFRFIFKPFLKLLSRKKEVEHSKFKTLVTIGAE